MKPRASSLVCPRCDASFLDDLERRDPRDCGEAWDRFAHHAQREHDLDEVEAFQLVFGRARTDAA